MRVVEQSHEILPEHADPVSQIASRARICYKSEDQSLEDEKPFLKRIWNHQPVFEMAVVSLRFSVSDFGESDYKNDDELFNTLNSSKYLHVSAVLPENEDKDAIIVTGSIRAWREFIMSEDQGIGHVILKALRAYNMFLFEDLECSVPSIEVPVPTVMESYGIRKLVGDKEWKKHHHVAVHLITNRAVTHEIVRHRPCAFLQESQRYCRYDQEKFGNSVTFIDPRPAFHFNEYEMKVWEQTMEFTEGVYFDLLKTKSAQAARTVLPNSCKTEIIVYCNLVEWEHIFARRVPAAAEPSMREQSIPLYKAMNSLFNGILSDPQISIG